MKILTVEIIRRLILILVTVFWLQIFSALGLVCLTSAGIQTDGGYLKLPLAWHLRTFVFVSVCGFLTSLMVILLHVTGLIKSAPINWNLFVSIFNKIFITYRLEVHAPKHTTITQNAWRIGFIVPRNNVFFSWKSKWERDSAAMLSTKKSAGVAPLMKQRNPSYTWSIQAKGSEIQGRHNQKLTNINICFKFFLKYVVLK